MIKVYLDWNVMSGMKNNYFSDLRDVIVNKEKFLLLYLKETLLNLYFPF